MKRPALLAFVCLILAGRLLSAQDAVPAESYFVYAGTFTRPTADTTSDAKGIYAWRFEPKTGRLVPLGLVAEAANAAHLWTHPNQRFLYAVNWATGDSGGDTVSAYAIEPKTGALTFLNKVSSHGASPNQIVLDPRGRVALTVTFKGGTVTAFGVEADGRLSEAFASEQHSGQPLSSKQPGPRVHGAVFSADGRWAYVADLGLDRIYSYQVDPAQRRLVPGDPPFVNMQAAGSGPRRLQLHPNGKFLYVNHETDARVSVFSVEGAHLQQIQSITTKPAGFSGKVSPAEILIDHTGRWLYVSNRGSDDLASFAVDQSTGHLALIDHISVQGDNPRNLALDPTNRFLVSSNQNSSNIIFFAIDPDSGRLSPTDIHAAVTQPGGVCFARAQP